jgi:hypothetical protein
MRGTPIVPWTVVVAIGRAPYGNNPMALDNETVCNSPGVIQTGVGWIALVLALAWCPSPSSPAR